MGITLIRTATCTAIKLDVLYSSFRQFAILYTSSN